MAINVFLSYAHEDEGHRRALEKHLAILRREGRIDVWHDRRIMPGQRFDTAIDEALERADIVLLLVSADFLDSDYCYTIELERALARERPGVTRVIPVIVSDCDWSRAPFAKFTAAPCDGLPVPRWPTADEAYADIAKRVRAAVESLAAARAPAAEAAAGPPERPVRRAFSERERLRFLRDAYADVLRELESLALGTSRCAPPLTGEIARIDAWTARCRARREGSPLRECVIWLVPQRGCIAYASTLTPAFDEGVCVDADEETLFLRALKRTGSGPARRRLSPREAAERIWTRFIAELNP